jgi:hypothetical protein
MLPDNFLTFEDCIVKKYFLTTAINVSALSITMINADRVLIFRFAMRYYTYITERTVAILCAITWPTAVVFSYLMWYDNRHVMNLNCDIAYQMADVMNNYVISGRPIVMIVTRSIQLLILLSNILMLIYGIYYIRIKLRRVQNSSTVPSSLGSRDVTLIRKLLCLTGSFLIMTTPLLIVLNLAYLVRWNKSFQRVVYACFMICTLNSALNPVVYVWRFREPRFQLQLLLCFFNNDLKDRIRQRRNQSLAEFEMQSYPRNDCVQTQEGGIH